MLVIPLRRNSSHIPLVQPHWRLRMNPAFGSLPKDVQENQEQLTKTSSKEYMIVKTSDRRTSSRYTAILRLWLQHSARLGAMLQSESESIVIIRLMLSPCLRTCFVHTFDSCFVGGRETTQKQEVKHREYGYLLVHLQIADRSMARKRIQLTENLIVRSVFQTH